MSSVEHCLQITKAIYSVLLNGTEETRDAMIEDVNRLFDEREKIIPSIKEPFTSKEREMGNHIMNLNSRIQTLLVSKSVDVKDELSNLRSKKTNMKKYINPYDQVDRDGTFYDKRN